MIKRINMKKRQLLASGTEIAIYRKKKIPSAKPKKPEAPAFDPTKLEANFKK